VPGSPSSRCGEPSSTRLTILSIICSQLKDVDATERARLVRAAGCLVPVSLLFFVLVTLSAVQIAGLSPGRAVLVGLVLGLLGPSLLFGLIQLYLVGGVTSLLGRIYFSPEPPLPRAESWRGQALAVRGSHDDAMKVFEDESERYPDDPGPCLLAAAVCLDELNDPENAIAWYLRARRAANLTDETDEYICVRLADICESIGEDSRATVELRRLLERHPDSEFAAAARGWLAILKSRQVEEHEAGGSSQ
jgi:hypothetical protein